MQISLTHRLLQIFFERSIKGLLVHGIDLNAQATLDVSTWPGLDAERAAQLIQTRRSLLPYRQ